VPSYEHDFTTVSIPYTDPDPSNSPCPKIPTSGIATLSMLTMASPDNGL